MDSERPNKIAFFRSFYDTLKDLPAEDVKEALCAVCQYAFDGEEPEELSPIANVFYKMAIPNIDASLSISQKRAETGAKGGAEKQSGNKRGLSKQNASENILLKQNDSEKNLLKQNNSEKNLLKQEYGIGIGIGIGDGCGVGVGDGCGNGVGSGNGVGIGSVDLNNAHAHTREDPAFPPPTVREVKEYIRQNALDVDAQAFVDHYNSVGWQIRGQPIQDWRARVNIWHRDDAMKKANPPPQKGSAYMDAIRNRVSDVDGWLERAKNAEREAVDDSG